MFVGIPNSPKELARVLAGLDAHLHPLPMQAPVKPFRLSHACMSFFLTYSPVSKSSIAIC